MVKELLPDALGVLRERRLNAGKPAALATDHAILTEKREELAAALDAAMGAYVNADLRQLLLAGMTVATLCSSRACLQGVVYVKHEDFWT